MNIKIFQINNDRDEKNLKFVNLERTVEYQKSEKINAKLYDEVFWGDVDAENLEDIFTKFNTESHPLHRGPP